MGDAKGQLQFGSAGAAAATSDGVGDDPFEQLPALVFRRRAEPPHAFSRIGGACAEIAGLAAAALEGDADAWWGRVPSEARERALAAIARAAEQRSCYRVVYAFSPPSGPPRTLREEARARLDGRGVPLGFDGVIVDVSDEHRVFEALRERDRAQTELRRSEERFRELTEHAHSFVAEITADARIRYVSPRLTEVLGYTLGDLVGRDVSELIHPEDRRRVQASGAESMARLTSAELLFRCRHRDGSWRWIELGVRPFRSASGELLGALIGSDVTERENASRRLREQLARETQIADLSRHFLALGPEEVHDAIRASLADVGVLAESDHCWLFSFDARQRRTTRLYEWCAEGVECHADRFREASSEVFPWSYQELMKGQVVQISDPAELPPEAQAEKESMQRRGVRASLGIPLLFRNTLVGYLGFETLRRPKTWSSETVTLLRLVGEIYASALRRNRAEEDLIESQTQLLQAQKMEAVGTLAGGIAHDFNNQLTVMLGNARYVQARLGDDANLRDAMVDLTRSAEHCAQLTRSLLTFSRRSAVSPSSLDVAAVLSEVRGLMRPLIPSAIRLDVALGEGVSPVSADPSQLQQVLVNLVVNARDAMPDGGRILISTADRPCDEAEARRIGLPGGGAYVEIAVHDDGAGMDEETRRRVFEPFFTTKELGQGTGLGLATAYGIVRESGGAIELESQVGRGTSVRLLLPRAGAAASQAEQRDASVALEGSETLLLVEDEGAVRRFVERCLEEHGYRVLRAESGDAGLRLGRRHALEIDALVSDLDMPGLDGLALARQLRKDRPGLAVLFLSGHSRERLPRLGDGLPGARFLQKPFSEEELLGEMRRLLDREGVR